MLQAEHPEFDTWQRLWRDILLTTVSRLALGATQPPTQLVLGVKQLEHEADHLPPFSAEVTNAWSYTSTPSYAFIVWCLFKYRIHLHGMVLRQRDNFTFILPFSWHKSMISPTRFLKTDYKIHWNDWLGIWFTCSDAAQQQQQHADTLKCIMWKWESWICSLYETRSPCNLSICDQKLFPWK
jgi:hypothetical protein